MVVEQEQFVEKCVCQQWGIKQMDESRICQLLLSSNVHSRCLTYISLRVWCFDISGIYQMYIRSGHFYSVISIETAPIGLKILEIEFIPVC